MATQRELERIDDLGLGAWDDHKPEGLVDLFADDFVWRDTTLPEPMTAREQALAYVQGWFTAFPDLSARRTNRIVGEDAVAVEVEFTGTNTGPLALGGMELPATGRSIVGRGAYFFRVRDGKIVEFSSHPDAAGLMAQLGLMPQA